METPLQCPGCGMPVHEDWRFCMECGAERPGLYEEGGNEQELEPEIEPTPLPGGREVRWRALEAVPVFLIHLVASFFVAALVVGIVGTQASDLESDIGTVIILISTQVAMAVTTVLWIRRRHRAGMSALGVHRFQVRYVGWGILTGLGGSLVAGIAAQLLRKIVEATTGESPSDPVQLPIQSEQLTGTLLVLFGLSAVVLAPIAEELYFRGMLHQGLRRWMRFWPGVLLSSAIFALVHVDQEAISEGRAIEGFFVVPSILVLAIAMTFMFERSQVLWVPIVAHMTFNLLGFSAGPRYANIGESALTVLFVVLVAGGIGLSFVRSHATSGVEAADD